MDHRPLHPLWAGGRQILGKQRRPGPLEHPPNHARFAPMVAKSAAAEVISSGVAITHAMLVRLLASPWLSRARRSSTRRNRMA